VVDLAVVDYQEALEIQRRLVAARTNAKLSDDVVLILEHPPVFTLGRRGGRKNLIVSETFLADRGIQVIQTERGGDITFHGPGQLVAYPIVHLESGRIRVVDFVHGLEELMIRTAARFGVEAGRKAENRGVWVGPKKLGSVGICVRHGVSFHGMALNVNLSLAPFGYIHPCGLEGVCMTSLCRELGRPVSMDTVRSLLTRQMETVFRITARVRDRSELHDILPPARIHAATRQDDTST
jgi:lipoate-protein ligase B